MVRTGRVLVIEDEPVVCEVAVAALADQGHDVRRARNGHDGLAVLRDWRPDVIVLDLMMPVLDGRGFRAEQRQLPGPTARTPVIVLSGAREVRAIAAELGAVAAIAKPFELDELVAAVERTLNERPG